MPLCSFIFLMKEGTAMAKYYMGNWNGHQFIIVNESAERMIVDNEVLAETKKGIRLSSLLTAPMPGMDGMQIYTMVETDDCSCIVGKPLEAEYDKKTKTYRAEYNGHTIEAVNKLKAKMLLDGEEVDREDEGMGTFCILGSPHDADGKHFMAVFDGNTGLLAAKVSIYAEAENVILYPCKKEGGEYIPLSDEEYFNEIAEAEDDGAAVITAVNSTINL